MPANLFPILLAIHVTLAVSLFLPSILLPFALRTRRATVESQSPVVRALLWAQSHGTVIIGAGLALTGVGLLTVLGPAMLEQPWLIVALAIYVAQVEDERLNEAVRDGRYIEATCGALRDHFELSVGRIQLL